MARKLFFKAFEDFRGVDKSVSHLTRPPAAATDFENIDVQKDLSIQCRRGSASEALGSAGTNEGLGLFVYTYQDRTTGATKQELLAVSDRLYKTQEATFVVTGPANSTFEFLPDPTTSSPTGAWILDCKVNGTSVGGSFPYNCGTGEGAPVVNVATVADAIQALAGWTCVVTPRAVVDGNQAGCDRANAITVLAGHTITISTTEPTLVPFEHDGDAQVAGEAIAQAATTVTLVQYPIQTDVAFNVSDGDEIGAGRSTVQALPTMEATSCSSALTIRFRYWVQVFDIKDFDLNNTSYVYYPNYHNYVAINKANNLYIGVPFSLFDAPYAAPNGGGNATRESGLLKYDGRKLIAAGGMFCSTAAALAGAGAGNVNVGTHKYLAIIRSVDHQGNVVDGNDSTFHSEQPVTTTAGDGQVDVTITYQTDTTRCLNEQVAMVNGNQSSAAGAGDWTINTKNVSGANNSDLRVGDYCSLFDNTSGRFIEYLVKAVTDTSITVDKTEAALTISLLNNDVLTNRLSCQIYRTKANGQTYYKLTEFPVDTYAGSKTYRDNIADTSLGEEWLGPYIGRERRDPPPVMGLLENHQGLIVGAGNPKEPESLYWSTELSPEYFPVSTNSLDVSSNDGGDITALASTSIDTIAAFRDGSYSIVQGDFYYNYLSIVESAEGDVGCPSPHGWQNIRGEILFISNQGPRVLRGAELVGVDERLATYFEDQWYDQDHTARIDVQYDATYLQRLVVRRTISVHDKENQRVLFFIPTESGFPYTDIGPNINSKYFVYDYRNKLWGVYTSAPPTGATTFTPLMGGGAVYYKNEVYWSNYYYGTNNGLVLAKRNKTNTKYDFVDNLQPIEQKLRPQWEFLEEPSIDKEFYQCKVWSFDRDSYVNSTMTFKTYRNFQNTTADTNTTLDFTGTDTDDIAELVLNRCKSIQLEFYNVTHFEAIHMTGYELTASVPYKKEHLEDKDK